MAKGGSGNTAGEMNVRFTGDASQVVAAAGQAKAALQSTATAGKQAGREIAEGAKQADDGLIANAKSANKLTQTFAKIAFPAAIMGPILEVFAQIEAKRQALVQAFERMGEGRNASRIRLQDLKLELDGFSELAKRKQKDREQEQKEIEEVNANKNLPAKEAGERIRQIHDEHLVSRGLMEELADKQAVIDDARVKDAERIAEAQRLPESDLSRDDEIAKAKAQAELNRLKEQAKNYEGDSSDSAKIALNSLEEQADGVRKQLTYQLELNAKAREKMYLDAMAEASADAIAKWKDEELARQNRVNDSVRAYTQLQEQVIRNIEQIQRGFSLGDAVFAEGGANGLLSTNWQSLIASRLSER